MLTKTTYSATIGKSRLARQSQGYAGEKIIIFFILLIIAFFALSCQQQKPLNQINNVLEKYLYVWNGGDLDSLDTITSENFQLRINPTFEPMTGRDKLKEAISKSHFAFPDFSVQEKEKIILSDTALALTWVIKGTFKNPEDSTDYARKTESKGFSIIFFNKGILTGEWIGYSDLTWYKNLGYELVIPKRK